MVEATKIRYAELLPFPCQETLFNALGHSESIKLSWLNKHKLTLLQRDKFKVHFLYYIKFYSYNDHLTAFDVRHTAFHDRRKCSDGHVNDHLTRTTCYVNFTVLIASH